MSRIKIAEFLTFRNSFPVIDVRSPAEYNRAHIPGAINLPLFSDDERAIVGTLYKQTGRHAAILKGLEIVGPKMKALAETGLELAGTKNTLLVHCWRGGMRSANMAWLFNLAGIRSFTLEGGYKSYRRYLRAVFALPYKLFVLNGKTGSGKTDILNMLANHGEQVIDLEKLANHKGSAFGGLGNAPQPVSEHFENLLADELMKLDSKQPVWVEDESHSIGKVFIPDEFFHQFRTGKIISIQVPKPVRIQRLVNEYACFSHEQLKASIEKIKKRLGGLNFKMCIEALGTNDYQLIADITLGYYDKAYQFGIENKPQENILTIDLENDDPEKNAQIILKRLKLTNFVDYVTKE